MQKIGREGPKWGGDAFFRHKKNLADILGRTDLDFENLFFGDVWDPKFLDFQVSRFQEIWLNRGLVANWPEGPSGPKSVDFLL